ncbi:unnamed protein product [Closterium sp. NIES-53]
MAQKLGAPPVLFPARKHSDPRTVPGFGLPTRHPSPPLALNLLATSPRFPLPTRCPCVSRYSPSRPPSPQPSPTSSHQSLASPDHPATKKPCMDYGAGPANFNSPSTSSDLELAQPARSPVLPAAAAAPASPLQSIAPSLAATAAAPNAPALRAVNRSWMRPRPRLGGADLGVGCEECSRLATVGELVDGPG